MNKFDKGRILMAVCLAATLAVQARATDLNTIPGEGRKELVVTIDYGKSKPARTLHVPLIKGKTVLETLQTAAAVETHSVGPFVFVIAINGIEGKRGEMAWYYTIDGKRVGELAYTKVLDGTEGSMQWTYTKDVCSWTVDGKPQAPK
ncbi:MAG: hypothetical protein WDA72_10495 [Desulfomonilia bacterium]|jgi:hypothetical protein|nr:DUF4430 domain-containing protein [Deltaproteobacteria bacterium]MDX9762997.1 hypothetical protein [Desulfomonilia bacterium]